MTGEGVGWNNVDSFEGRKYCWPAFSCIAQITIREGAGLVSLG